MLDTMFPAPVNSALDASLMFTIKSMYLFLALTLAVSSYGQNAQRLKVFDPVPVNQHHRIAERLKILVGYERARQWANLFDMVPKIHNQHPEESKEQFIKQMNIGDMIILEFVPEYATTNPTIDAEYMIFGCSKTRLKRRTAWYKAAVGAAFENREWYFTPIFLVTGVDAPPEPCKPRPASHNSLNRSGISLRLITRDLNALDTMPPR